MRFVRALHWLRDMVPSVEVSLRKRLVPILKDPEHGQIIQNDLRSARQPFQNVIIRPPATTKAPPAKIGLLGD